MPFKGSDPPHFRTDHHDRLTLDQGFKGHFDFFRRITDFGTTLAKGCLLAEFLAHFLDFVADFFPTQRFAGKKRFEAFFLFGQFGMLVFDFHLFELAQRPQTHIKDRIRLNFGEIEGRHQGNLRLILEPNDPDHLVQVQIGNKITIKNFKAMIDLGQSMVGTTDKNILPMRQKRTQHFAQVHHARRIVPVQHVHVQTKPDFQFGILEQHFHQMFRLDSTGARFEHQTDQVGRLITDIGQKRKLFQHHKVCNTFDQFGFLNLIGNFGHNDLEQSMTELLDFPSGAQTE